MADAVVSLALVGLVLAAAGWLSHRLRLPPALGYLAVGMAAGPLMANQDTGLPPELFTHAAEIAVLFLLFAIGIELDLKKLRQTLAESAVTLPLDILVPALAVAALAKLWGWSLVASAAVGLCVSLSSTLFGERLTTRLSPPVRRRVIGVLVAEDMAAGALLAMIAILGGEGEGWFAPVQDIGTLLIVMILLAAVALLVVPRILDAVARTHSHDLLVLWAVGAVVGFGALGMWAGSAELGALIGGVAAAEAGSRFSVRNSLQGVRDLALAVFFFASGFTVVPNELPHAAPLALLVAAVVLASKMIVHVPAALSRGLDLRGAMEVGLSLGTLGEFSLILVAAAETHGVAAPQLRAVVVGALLILLVTAPILLNLMPGLLRLAQRLPPGLRRPFGAAVKGLRQPSPNKGDPQERRRLVRRLTANVLLVMSWGLLSGALGTLLLRKWHTSTFWGPTLVFGGAVAVASPLLYQTYRSYRDLVWALVGLRPGQSAAEQGALKLRARLVDGWVIATGVVLLIPVSLLAPNTLPVLLGGLFLAVVFATLAWRQLSRFQRAMESSITRVLGEDVDSGALLDQILEKYPWGVHFSAVAVPPGSPLAGRSLQDSRITVLTGASVAVLQRRHREIVNPEASEVILVGDTVVFMGDPHQLARAEALVVAHGEAIRLTAQSKVAEVTEIEVIAGSALVGQRLIVADLPGRTGVLLVGVWPSGTEHPTPYDADLVIRTGDRLIVLGSPLQVARARELATEPAPAPTSAPKGSGPGWGSAE